MRRFLRSLCLALFVLALFPVGAFARSFSVEQVDIDATVSSNGSLWVDEKRIYSFDGSFGGIYWDVPRGTYEGRTIEPEIRSISVVSGGESSTFVEGYEEAPGTYELSMEKDCYRLKLYWPAEDESVTFQVQYDLSELATRWADVGELYWQYVPADEGSGDEWHDISCTVHLPIPDGAPAVAGKDVRAWGHGPLDGEVSVDPDKVTLFSPGVGAAEFLEVRAVFPESWIADAPTNGTEHLDTVLEEEGKWAEEANAKRRHARMIVYGIPGSMAFLSAGSLAAMMGYRAWVRKKSPKPQFNDTYFRDVPTNDHPAVLGMLYREDEPKGVDFSATLMRLTDQKRIALDDVTHDIKTKRGGTKSTHEWRMLLFEQVKPNRGNLRAGGKKIDDEAFDFLYDVVADKHKHDIDQSLLGPSGEPYVLMSFFNEVAETWPEEYAQGYGRWSKAVRAAYGKRGFEMPETAGEIIPGLLGLGDFALAVVLAIAGMFLGVPGLWICIAFVVLFGTGIAIILLDEGIPSVIFSQEAVEIKAQLAALRNWLVDFTRLEEAIPTDVVLWNRLLVMATELGVADKVVKQLRIHVPDVLANLSVAAWCGGALDTDPAEVFERSVERGCSTSSEKLYHEVSTYDTATSHDSSSDGDDGGFSFGGGGGFSGGGRGGAF